MARGEVKETDKPAVVFSTEADKDYLLCRMLAQGGVLSSRAGFFAQQACEKYLKAVTVHKWSKYLETHALQQLADFAKDLSSHFSDKETRDLLQRFDVFDQVGRYGAAAKYDPLAQKEDDFQTAGVSYWEASYISRLDRFVHQTRGLLAFPNPGQDYLARILDRTSGSDISASWPKFLPPPYEILIHENEFFRPPSA